MKGLLKCAAVGVMAAAVFASCTTKGGAPECKNDVDSLSYAFGSNIGTMFKQNIEQIPGGEGKTDSIIKGFKDGLDKEQSYIFGMQYASHITGQIKTMTDGEKANTKILVAAFIAALNGDSVGVMSEQDAMMFLRSYVSPKKKTEKVENLKKGEEFLAENAKKEGVKTTASGLQYQVVTEGDGKTFATAEDQVKVNYKGTVIDGKEFDKGEGVTFGVTQVIPGWTEGLQLMSKGASYKFFIPANLAYGDQDRGDVIKANSVLIFEVTLVDVIKAKK